MTSPEEIMSGERNSGLEAARKTRLARAQFKEGVMSREESMSLLAEAFHSLAGMPGVRPWDPDELARHVKGPAGTAGSLACVAFVLSVYATNERWEIPRHVAGFDIIEALGCWDGQNRAAFVAWAEAPWWP